MASSLAGTGNQPYTAARIDYLANYLQTLLPGLTHEAAVKWITAEKGVNGNVLGLTHTVNGKQTLYTYSSQEAGLRAAASWLKSAPSWTGYPAVIASLKTGDTTAQLKALAASKWSGGGYYQKAFLGTSAKSTTTAVTAKATTAPAKSGSGKTVVTSSAATLGSGGATATAQSSQPINITVQLASDVTQLDPQLVAKLKAIGVSTDPTHVISEAEAALIAQKLYNQDPTSTLGKATISKLTGITIGSWAGGSLGQGVPLPDVTGALAGLGGFFSFFSANVPELLAIIVGVPIALIGFYLLVGVQQQTA